MISNQYENFQQPFIPTYKAKQRENKKNFQQPFTPTPKGSLLEILLTGIKEIKCTPFFMLSLSK